MNLSSDSEMGPVEGEGRRVVLVREKEVRSQPSKAIDFWEQLRSPEAELVGADEAEEEGVEEVGVGTGEGMGTGSWGAGTASAGVRRRRDVRKFIVAVFVIFDGRVFCEIVGVGSVDMSWCQAV